MTTLVVETSALLRRYLGDRDRPVVVDAMANATTWAGSALTRTEVLMALRQVAPSAAALDELWSTARRDWDSFWEIPLDHRCLVTATEIGTQYGLDIIDSIHLSAATRLPGRIQFCSFAPAQYAAAEDLGFELVTA